MEVRILKSGEARELSYGLEVIVAGVEMCQ